MAPPNGVTYQDIPNPAFAIVGAPHPSGEGVVLLASRHITTARLRALAQDEIPLAAMTRGWMLTGVFLSLHAGIDDYVLVAAPDYPQAFALLFRQWEPQAGRKTMALDTAAALLAIEATPNNPDRIRIDTNMIEQSPDSAQREALIRHGYDPDLLPRGVTGPPEQVIKVRVLPDVDGQPQWNYLRNRVCYLDGIEIDGHEGSDLDPAGNTCIHCGEPLWEDEGGPDF